MKSPTPSSKPSYRHRQFSNEKESEGWRELPDTPPSIPITGITGITPIAELRSNGWHRYCSWPSSLIGQVPPPVLAVVGRSLLPKEMWADLPVRMVYALTEYADQDSSRNPQLSAEILHTIGNEVRVALFMARTS